MVPAHFPGTAQTVNLVEKRRVIPAVPSLNRTAGGRGSKIPNQEGQVKQADSILLGRKKRAKHFLQL